MLPKIEYPIHEIALPSDPKRVLKFRPFLVREEKILLTAKEADDHNASRKAVKQVVNNTCLDTVDVEELPIFDLEWIFLQLRIHSISNEITQEYEDREDDQVYRIKIDLLKVQKPTPTPPAPISLGNGSHLILRYPPSKLFGSDASEEEAMRECAVSIATGDSVAPIEEDAKAFSEWFETLPISVSDQVRSFFDSIPTISLDVEYKNSKGTKRTIHLEGLTDFFDLR